ncbi:MAG: ABC transporter C-terminal domain-containing protein [Steroidobacteraceae bacterium]
MIDLLSGKGKFPTEQALVLAEAIDMAIEKTQFVTVPILDARFAAVDVRFAAVDARFAAVDARFARLEARMESGFVAVNARLDALEAKMDLKMERWAVRMVIAMVVSQTALGPIGMSALDAVRRALSTVVH